MNENPETISIPSDSRRDSCESLRVLDNAPSRSKIPSMNHHATASAKPSGIDVTEFVHRARKRRIFRREEQGNFYIRKQVENRDHWKSLDTPIAKIAILRARAWLDEIDAAATSGKWERLDPLRSRSPWATIGQIIQRWTGDDQPDSAARADTLRGRKLEARHADSCASSLRTVLRTATAEPEPDQLRADVLTEATARSYVAAARAAGRSENGIKSTLTQARCITAPAIMHIYSDLRIPDLTGWRTPMRFDIADELGFSPIPADTEQAMETAAASLRDADPATWLTYMLMSRLGLRNIECERATLDMLRPDDSGTWHLHIPKTKGGNARALALPADLPASEIRRIAGDGPHIIPASNRTERRDICQRQINRFVARFLPDRSKCAYELRKWAGSLVWSTQGSEAAQAFLGHRSIATTERYYARFLRPVRAVSAADREAVRTPGTARGAA